MPNNNDNVITHKLLERIKEKKEQHEHLVPEEISSIIDALLKPGDLAGFLRVIEILRAIGDLVEISADITAITIKCEQTAAQREIESNLIVKESGAIQTTSFEFECIHEHDSLEDDVPFDEYIDNTTNTLRKSIEALTYWDDGKINDEEEDT